MTPFVYKQGWNDERKLLKKLAEIMKEARYIQKRGTNKFHNYNYVTEADVNEKIGDMLSERNIVFFPNILSTEMRETETKSGKTEYIQRADMEFTFMDAETGEAVTTHMSGEGQDVGDKAIYKAISGTQKYVLLKVFMLASGDDPEGDESVDQRNAEKPSKDQKAFNKEAEKQQKSLLPDLKAKWQILAGSLYEFEDFYKKQKEKKFTDQQINAYLTKKIADKKDEPKQEVFYASQADNTDLPF